VSIAGSGAGVTVTPVSVGAATITATTQDGGFAATCSVTVAPADIEVTSVWLAPYSMDLTVGGANGNITAGVLPADATNKNLAWSVGPAGVVTVAGTNSGATVTPIAAGTATITATAHNGRTNMCNVTVAAANVPVSGVSVSPATLSLTVGGTAGSLTATIAPADATNKTVTWVSSNAAAATVVGSGLTVTVVPVAAGAAVITVKTEDGSFQASCVVIVMPANVPVTGVTLAPAALNLTAGGAAGSLTATVLPANATNKNVTWTSSDASKATVIGSGLTVTVAPVVAGTAVITVTTQDGGLQAACLVTVTNPPPQKVYVGGEFGLITDGAAQAAYDGYTVYAIEVIDGVVHACGMTKGDAPRAVYWVDGTRQDLPMTAGATVSGAHGMCVNGGDVYVAGWEAPSLGDANLAPYLSYFSPPATSKARLWKNGQTLEFHYPHNLAGTIQHTGSYGLCLAMVWEPELNRHLLWMGGNLKMTDGTDGTAVWIAEPNYHGYQTITAAGDNQPPHFWSLAAELAPARRLYTASPEFGVVVIDWDAGELQQPYGSFGAYSVRFLNGTLYAAGWLLNNLYPAAYMVDGVVHELEDGSGPDFLYSEAWDINLGPGGVVHICGGDFFGTNWGETITGVSPRLWQNGVEVIVPGWTGDKTKGLALAVAATNP
jgi:uncharacterized protein YjdB